MTAANPGRKRDLEVETQAQLGDIDHALAAVRAIVAELGVAEDELTVGAYTDEIRAARLGYL